MLVIAHTHAHARTHTHTPTHTRSHTHSHIQTHTHIGTRSERRDVVERIRCHRRLGAAPHRYVSHYIFPRMTHELDSIADLVRHRLGMSPTRALYSLTRTLYFFTRALYFLTRPRSRCHCRLGAALHRCVTQKNQRFSRSPFN